MLKVTAIDGITPVVDPSAYVHPSAVLVGDVIVGARVYVGPCACLRGDFGRIVIGEGANIQDCCILHAFPDRDLVVEADGHIGHGAVLHGCVVRRNAMVGINSVVNDNAVVGESSIVAAMAFVKAGFEVPPRCLALGIPAKVVRELSAEEMAWKRDATRQYQELAVRSLATARETVARSEVEPDRPRFRDPSVMPLSEMKKGVGK
ncbi:MAG: phenylacetic acid degradation protein PaaY [Burkholderiales bacterium]